jgi:hypothetical protein
MNAATISLILHGSQCSQIAPTQMGHRRQILIMKRNVVGICECISLIVVSNQQQNKGPFFGCMKMDCVCVCVCV